MKKLYVFIDEEVVDIDGHIHRVDLSDCGIDPEWEAMHWWFDKKKGMIEHRSHPENKPWEKGDENEWTEDYKIFEKIVAKHKDVSLSPEMYDLSVKGKLNKLYTELANLEQTIAFRKANGLAVDQDEYRRKQILKEMKVENLKEAKQLHERVVKNPM
jgi:hypothetical protein